MIEKKLYQEIPGGRNKFHSAVMTSFSFNFHHFENQVLRTLRQKWVSNILILVDQRMLDCELGVASGKLKYLGQSYSVSGIESKGAFHPKLNFLIGDNHLLLFFGSGNITSGGHGKNHELFTGFYADKDNQVQLPLILEAWDYLHSVADQLEGYNRERLFKVLPRSSSLLGGHVTTKHKFYSLDKEVEVALLYHDESTIFEQIIRLVSPDEVTQITVVCPYFDEDGAVLRNFNKKFNRAKIDVYLPSKYGLPPNKMENHDAIRFYNWEKTYRGKQSFSEDYYRRLHTKLFCFKAGDHEYSVIGSANATIAGLGDENGNSVNEEFCALYKFSGNGLLEDLGIRGKKHLISVEKLERNNSLIPDPDKIVHNKKSRIYCADLNGRLLQIKFNTTSGLDRYIAICDSNGNRLLREFLYVNDTNSSLLTLSDNVLDSNPAYVVFESDSSGEISNKQLINFIDKLHHTDPSKGNRTIRQVLTSLEGGTINEFEIIEFINDLNRSREASSRSKSMGEKSSIENRYDHEISAAEMTYEEAIEAAKDQKRSEVIIRRHSSIQLWETISRLFAEKHIIVSDEMMDEEEGGSAECSRDRNVADQDHDKIVIKNIDHSKKMINSVTKLADNYIGQLNRIYYKADHKINELDLGNFLLVTHILTVVCNLKEYQFAKDEDTRSYLEELEQLYVNKMLAILEHFVKLLIKLQLVNCHENDHQKPKFDEFLQKVGYHFWLYVYLLQHKSWYKVLRDKVDLAAMNFLHFIGEPDKGFDQYLKTLSAAYNDLYFNPLAVMRFSDKLLSTYLNPAGHYIGIDHSGICRILRHDGHQFEYTSLFSRGKINQIKLKKHRIY